MSVRVASPRFVGRDAELAALETAVADAAAGRPAVVLIAGEAGVGKSRLVRELAHEQRGGPARVLVGHCVEVAEGELPYAPVVGALRSLVADVPPDELDDLVGPARGALERLLPDLADRRDESAPAGDINQARLFELLLGLLGRAGRDRPLVLVIEDLHSADASTRDLMRFLVLSTTSERLALVGTYRNDDLHRRHPLRPLLADLDRDPRVRRVTVAPFSRDELADHVAAITGELPEGPVVDDLYARSEGNAFFTEELLAASAVPGELPESVRDAMFVRLERLSEPAQQVVRVAAAAGRRVDHRLLATVAGVDEATLSSALREAVAAQVLVPDPSDRSYEFRHALLREAAYEDLLLGEREALHLSLARALDGRPELAGGSTSVAAELAYHWFAGYELELALPASIAAGEEAVRVAAYAEAQRHFERALDLYGRVAAEHRGHVDEVELLRLAAEAAYLAGSHDPAAALIRRAIDQIDADADPTRAALLTERLGHYVWEGGNTDEAVALAARAAELMPDGPTAERAQVLAAEAQMLVVVDRPAEAHIRCEEALAIAHAVGAREVEASALGTFAVTSLEKGDYDGAIASARQARAIAEEIGDFHQSMRAYVNGCEGLERAGRLDESIDLALEGVKAAALAGSSRVHGTYLMAEAVYRLLKRGRTDEAIPLAEDALRLAPTGANAVFQHQNLAQAALHRGDVDTARVHRRQAADGQMHGSMWIAPEAMIDTLMLLLEGDPNGALRTAERALAALGEHEYSFYTAPLRALGARAAADAAEAARGLRDEDPANAAATAGRVLAARLEDQVAELGADAPPETVAHLGQLQAELTRADGRSDSELWDDARRRWSELGMSPAEAYCHWRLAEALVAAGDRSGAQAIARAYAAAVATGAQPLVAEIEALARRSRLPLDGGAEDSADSVPAPPDSAAERVGLTAREQEVLRFVVEGQTNRRIGEQLYITEKTASVHVSRIMAKLGAANRSEAAAVARRLGLVDTER